MASSPGEMTTSRQERTTLLNLQTRFCHILDCLTRGKVGQGTLFSRLRTAVDRYADWFKRGEEHKIDVDRGSAGWRFHGTPLIDAHPSVLCDRRFVRVVDGRNRCIGF